MRRAGLLSLVFAALLTPGAAAAPLPVCTKAPTFDPSVPTWQAVNGFTLGSRPATGDEIGKYLAAVDRVSSRVATGVLGTSLQGRPLPYAIVSGTRTLRPARLAAITARLRGAMEGKAVRGAADDPVTVWLAANVHGNEPSGADADMRVLYDLAARRDCATARRLRAVLTVVLPIQNPDGRAADTRSNAAGFDLNRDWFARTQPETEAKVEFLLRIPPVLFADQHEEAGNSFFFPPNADPVHHEISARALHAMAIVGRGLGAAFDAAGVPFSHYQGYDLLFMGYGDTATTTLFGAAGMTFEKGLAAPFATRVDEHALAAAALVAVAARHRRELRRGWEAQWREARSEGALGRLEPNAINAPGDPVPATVPADPVYAYALRADVHAADAAALVARLRSVGVRVEALRQTLRVPRFHPYGAGGTAPATLPAGTYIVGMAQPAKHWVQAMLGEDAYQSVPASYDTTAWSNPLLMGVRGGLVRRPVPAYALAPVPAPGAAAAPAPGAGGWTFDGDSLGALALAAGLVMRGVALARVPGSGVIVVPPTADPATLGAAASTQHVPLRSLAATPAGTTALRAPKVAMLAEATSPSPAGPETSAAWMRWLVGLRLGLPVDAVGADDLALGTLATRGYTALVVADGDATQLSTAAAVGLQAWLRAGGTIIGERGRGLAVLQSAGLVSAAARLTPAFFASAGAAVRLALNPADPIAWGMGDETFALDVADPILEAHGDAAHVAASYPADARFFASGQLDGAQALRGTPAVLDVPVGAGRAVLFSFDAAFRGYTEGTERLVANALLAPPGPPGGRAG